MEGQPVSFLRNAMRRARIQNLLAVFVLILAASGAAQAQWDNATPAYPFSSTRYNCLYVVGCCWLPSPRSVWKAAIGVRLRLNRKTNSSR
jgi:hypothetical protein